MGGSFPFFFGGETRRGLTGPRFFCRIPQNTLKWSAASGSPTRAVFAATRINWSDKVQNLREIAAELNIGTDALAFMDDNPVECEQIRAAMPELA